MLYWIFILLTSAPTDQGSDGRTDLNAFAVELGGKDARVRVAFGCELAGLVLVAVQAIHRDGIEDFQVALAHPGKREAVQPGVVRDERNYAFTRFLDDAPLRHAEEPDVKVVQALALWRRGTLGGAVSIAQ